MTDRLEIVIIELPKAIRQYRKDKGDKISQWMMFLDNPEQKEVVQIMDINEDIKKAAEELDAMSEDDELRAMAELRLKGLRDEQAALEYAINRGISQGIEQGLEQGIAQGIEQGLEQGIAQGIEQGLEQGIEQGEKKKQIEIAKNMLQKNMSINDIIEITGLTKEEIEQI